MNIPIKLKNDVITPPSGYVFPFIDKEDMQLKAKLSDGIIINYTSVNEDMKVISLSEYTAFEVMPNKKIITSGTVDDKTGLTYSIDIPVCTTHKFTLRSSNPVEDNDVVIDWGDGTVEAIKNGKYKWISNKNYELSHDYSKSMKYNVQRFIIKIYGNNYYTFRHNSYENNNLISRIFTEDLPIASHIGNLASAAIHSKRLLKVHFPHSTTPYSNVWNWSYTFSCCENLQSVLGFEDIMLRGDAYYDGFMNECVNLKTTDFVIPSSATSLKGIFDGDINLECDIEKILPLNGFSSSNILIKNVFNKTKIYGTIPSEKLWGDKNINWKFEGTSNMPFSGCSDEILSQVPKSWGGFVDDSNINLTVEERLESIESILKDHDFLVL